MGILLLSRSSSHQQIIAFAVSGVIRLGFLARKSGKTPHLPLFQRRQTPTFSRLAALLLT
jgi:hypothetical protein